jgi:CubicO group peptidase (beta-lactamase class C family)
MTLNRFRPVLLLIAALLAAQGAGASELSAEMANSLRSNHVLFWTPEQQRVGYRNYRNVFATRTIRRGEAVWPLPEATGDFSTFRYQHQGETLSLDDYMSRMNTVGLIIVQDGEVLLERYTQGNDRETRWVSYSITKSVVSLLYGAAVKDGLVKSTNDTVSHYEPVLAGGSYDGVSIRNLLQMSSGVAWNEDYGDPDSDVSQTIVTMRGGNQSFLGHMAALPRAHPPGTEWNYNTGETIVAGSVLSAAVGANLSDYLSEKIWSAFGMESDADWLLLREGDLEYGGCCISATLRDYARLGLFALHNGPALDGDRVLPESWMQESLAASETAPFYGYFWWLSQTGAFSANGVFGQRIHVVPEQGLVIAMHSYWPRATGRDLSDHRNAFLAALTASLQARQTAASP